jgi:predicted RNA-binding Zn ribbon-like protein
MESENYRFQFIAGNLALDFVNTVAFRADPEKRQDRLQRPEDVYRWISQAQLPDVGTITSGPRSEGAAMRHIRAVREQLFEVFHAIATEGTIPDDILIRVGDALQDSRSRRSLAMEGGDVQWTWRPNARFTDHLLFPVLTAATELLTSVSRRSVRQCEDASCGWLFLDRSNARTRRWCSMADCGNRNKARKHYRRELS